MKRVYLDHTATTPLDPRVMEAMAPFFSECFGNASSVHSYGREAKSALEKARESLARAIGAQSGEIIFTSGGTESNNLALFGVAGAARKNGKNHIITTAADHHAVLEPCQRLAESGFDVTVLPVDSYGRVAPEQVAEAITPSTCLVSIIHANNEVGSITDIPAIARTIRAHNVTVHTDAVQSVGKIPVNVDDLGVDLLTFSGHKMYGPKGIGALYVRKGTALEPLLLGGGQERGRRPGTENVPLAVGFARAVGIALDQMQEESAKAKQLRDELEMELQASFPGILMNGHPTERLPHILNISFDSRLVQMEGEMVLLNMDLEGIAVTSGSACTSGSMQPSHVLLAIGRDARTARATLRFAFGRSNTADDVSYVKEALTRVVQRMKGTTPSQGS